MLQQIDLRELAAMESSGRDFVSMYFSRQSGRQSLQARERTLRHLLADFPDEAEHFESSMQLIHELLDDHPTDAEAICAFSCAVLDFVRAYPISMEVPAGIWVGPSPHIRPLAELQDEYQTFALVACNNKSTRVYLVTNEEAELEEQIRGDIKNHVRKGGWSQRRYSRRREQQLHRYAEEVAEVVEDLVRSHHLERVVLIGSQETMHEIEAEMSEQVREKILAKQAFDLKRGEDEMVENAYAAYFEEEHEVEEKLWERIKNEYKRHGLATVGPEAVLAAVHEGRADTIIVTRNLQITGTQCRDCVQVAHGTREECQHCGSKSVFEIDLVDALARQAELTSAYVEFSDEMPGLSAVGHVAALLRY